MLWVFEISDHRVTASPKSDHGKAEPNKYCGEKLGGQESVPGLLNSDHDGSDLPDRP